MQHHYKLHTIVMTSWGSLDGFTTEVRISKETAIAFHTLKINQPFPTKGEAESHGLEIAKTWIDGRRCVPPIVDRVLSISSTVDEYKRRTTGCATPPVFLSASAQLRPVENPAERASVSVEKNKLLSSGNL